MSSVRRRLQTGRRMHADSRPPWMSIQGALFVLLADRGLTTNGAGAVTAAGTTPPTITVSGTATGPWDMRVEITGAGARGTATGRWSRNGGSTWTAFTTAALVVLTGTGFSAVFSAGDYSADNVYTWTPTITTWADVSTGTGFAVTQPTSAARPLFVPSDANFGNAPSLNFAGDTFVQGAFPSAVSQPGTVYLVHKSVGGWLLDGGSDGESNRWGIYSPAFMYTGGGSTANITSPGTAASISCAVFNGSSSAYCLNSATVTNDSLSLGVTQINGVTLSGRFAGDTFDQARIAAAIMFSGAHDLATRSTVVRWLADRFRLTLT